MQKRKCKTIQVQKKKKVQDDLSAKEEKMRNHVRVQKRKITFNQDQSARASLPISSGNLKNQRLVPDNSASNP